MKTLIVCWSLLLYAAWCGLPKGPDPVSGLANLMRFLVTIGLPALAVMHHVVYSG